MINDSYDEGNYGKTLYSFRKNKNYYKTKGILENSDSTEKKSSKLYNYLNKMIRMSKKQIEEKNVKLNRSKKISIQKIKCFLNQKVESINTNKINDEELIIKNNNNIKDNQNNIDKEIGKDYKKVVLDPKEIIITPYNSNGLITLVNRKYENRHLIKENSTPSEEIYLMKLYEKRNKYENFVKNKTIQ